jgi:hypothetical protein
MDTERRPLPGKGLPMELRKHRPVSILTCLSNVRKAADQSRTYLKIA